MNRRVFIKNTTIATLMPYFLGSILSCDNKQHIKGKKVFVFVQLMGGNDGLNTLIPIDQYKNLSKARGNILIPENKALSLKGTSETALHPAMEGIRDMYDSGLVSFVQGVGYENSNYSHFRSSDILLTGSNASEALYTGWMARYLETSFKNYPSGFPDLAHPDPPAIKVGDTGSFLFEGYKMDMSIVLDPYKKFESADVSSSTNMAETYAAEEINSIREILLQTKAYSKVFEKAQKSSFNHSKLYPKSGENYLADQLKMVAKLIHSEIQTTIYLVDMKGFDTHESQQDQGDTTKGSHTDLLKNVSQAITCFWDDINIMGRENDVAGVIFSEFGRRIKSNASRGTDHGSSQPFIFFGANLEGGMIGKNPTIPDIVLDSDNLEMQYDYRSVYASILKGWINLPDARVKEILNNEYPTMKIFRS